SIKIRKSDDNSIKLNIRKDSHGSSSLAARERAKQINYTYQLGANEILLDEYLTTATSNKARNQEVTTTIYVPEDKVLMFDESTRGHIGRGIRNDQDLYRSSIIGYTWIMGDDGELKCQDCPEDVESEEEESEKIIIDKNGININVEDGADSFKMKIDQNGVEIKAEEKDNN
ncbi:MAG: hypothetical protein AB3N18_02710, partial [Allomuricauda sp.]